MDIHVLRSLFVEGVLANATVMPSEDESWFVVVHKTNGSEERITTLQGGDKYYKRIPAALEDVRRIGFKDVIVHLPDEEMPIRK